MSLKKLDMKWLLKGAKIISFMNSSQTPNFNPKNIIRNITQLTENGLKQYIKFRGSKPKIEGLLKASGIAVNFS